MAKDMTESKLLARLMAVQALYSWEASGSTTAWTKEDLTADMAAFYREQAGNESGIENFVKEDRKLFRAIASEAAERCEAIDAAINPHLSKQETIRQLAMTLRAILRAATCELLHLATPKGVVLKEYDMVTQMLAGTEDIGFVHAVLNKVVQGAEGGIGEGVQEKGLVSPEPAEGSASSASQQAGRGALTNFPDLSHMTAETLSLMLTRDPAWIKQAQQLRHKVFIQEEAALQGNADTFSGHEVDEDHFDAVCDHLLVLDTPEGGQAQVVGTYRLLRSNTELKFDRFYTETEFDISKILAKGKAGAVLLELGRSCIAPDYRNGAVIQLLWRAIGTYLVHYKIDYMFGCASFHGTDPVEFRQALSYLHHKHLAPEEIRSTPMPGWKAELEVLQAEQVDRKLAQEQLPPLLKGYMRLGGYVGEGAVVDKDFHTVDVCIIVDSQNIPRRYKEHFLDEAQQAAFPAKKAV